jgi:Coenzyme PQQ synthesis protein D (PqqD)
MIRKAHIEKPVARKEGLVIQELPDETLVYDLDSDKAHCLNRAAALVWKRCDGRATTASIAQSVATELQTPVDEKVVWLALDQLGRNNLLEQQPVAPPMLAGLNRREMVRVLGIAAAVTVPLVTSILAPTPANAASCIASGQPCTSGPQCCSGSCTGSPLTCV